MDFQTWKASRPVVHVAKAIEFAEELSLSADWDDYRARLNAKYGDEASLLKSATRAAMKFSSGEKMVLGAMLHAGDMSHLADQLSGTATWKGLAKLRGEFADAVASAINRP